MNFPLNQKFRILDLFCKAGGASYGMFWVDPLHIDITGVDIEHQPRYPFKFIQADFRDVDLTNYDFIWASPPCQRYSRATHPKYKLKHPDLIPEVRKLLQEAGSVDRSEGIPYVIENVVCSPLNVSFKLRGEMFGLNYQKERLFESNFFIITPFVRTKPKFNIKLRKVIRESMNLYWMQTDELRNAIPPDYSYYILSNYFEQQKRLLNSASKVPAFQPVFPSEGF